jgi:hypothetical protein
VHEFFAKIARFGVSKGAAFCYAVTVGVSGQLAYNYLQPKEPVPTAVAVPAPAMATAPAPTQNSAPAAPPPVAVPAAVARPAPIRPVAIAPILPDPPSASLPSPAALPTPILRPAALPPAASPPAALPPSVPIAAPGEAVAKPEATAKPEPPATLGATATAPLPPLGAAIDVASPPAPRPSAAAAPPAPAPGGEPDKRQPWELSDVWHPTRAVEKGLGWAGDQLPLIGGASAETPPRAALPAGPISLLPPAAPEAEKAVVPVRPGPGSGGLY